MSNRSGVLFNTLRYVRCEPENVFANQSKTFSTLKPTLALLWLELSLQKNENINGVIEMITLCISKELPVRSVLLGLDAKVGLFMHRTWVVLYNAYSSLLPSIIDDFRVDLTRRIGWFKVLFCLDAERSDVITIRYHVG